MLTNNRLKSIRMSIRKTDPTDIKELFNIYYLSNIFTDLEISQIFSIDINKLNDVNKFDISKEYNFKNYSDIVIRISKFYENQIRKLSRHEFCDLIINETGFLDVEVPILIRVWHILNDSIDSPKCIECGNQAIIVKNKYSDFCSVNCSKSSNTTLLNRKRAMVEKYGTENIMMLDSTKDKIKKTSIERYGVSHPMKDNLKKVFVDRYGVDNPSKLDFVKEKKEQTLFEKFAVKNPNHINMNSEILNKLEDISFLKEQHIVLKKSLTQISDELGITISSLSKRFAKYNIPVNPIYISIKENDIFNFINGSCTYDIIQGYKLSNSKQELDIYIPELKLAFEYDGLYWHSQSVKLDKNYHLNKTIECKKQDIKLIHIFENEWINQQDIVKSRILNLIGKSNKIFARKCKICIVNDEEKRIFLNDNHIQGDCVSSINIGLCYYDKLVSIMTFSKSRFNKNYKYELLRFCNVLNYTIVGGASKLLKLFIKKYSPNSIISYADLRWSNGNLYNQLNFKYSHFSNPSYWYFKGNELKLYNRLFFQKHRLEGKLKDFNQNLTEYENMLNNRYRRIFDCGNLVYTMENIK
ncbi:MAG: hypothetical protein H8D97_00605 [Proteobacteria bacterium]|nr:hypothetical protein [Pseudomonadota bacterium]